jgi:hypothetical protein
VCVCVCVCVCVIMCGCLGGGWGGRERVSDRVVGWVSLVVVYIVCGLCFDARITLV